MTIKPNIKEMLQRSFHSQMVGLRTMGWTVVFDDTDPLYTSGTDSVGERFECRAKYEVTHGSDGSTFYTVLTAMRSLDREQPGDEMYAPLSVVTETREGDISFF